MNAVCAVLRTTHLSTRTFFSVKFYGLVVQTMPRTYRRKPRRNSRRFKRRVSRRKFRRNFRGRGSRPKRVMWPNVLNTKLKYTDVDTPALSIPSGDTRRSQYYVINGAYDVNPSLSSSTMPGFAEYAAMYHKYRVNAVKIKMEAVPAATSGGVQLPVILGMHLDSGSVTLADWMETMQLLNSNSDSVSRLATPYQKTRLSMYRKLGKLFGNSLQYKADDNFDAATTSNPDSTMRGYVFALTADGDTAPAAIPVYVRITVTMYIRFSDKKQIFGS